jgi:hypothetical protein
MILPTLHRLATLTSVAAAKAVISKLECLILKI